MLIQYPLVQFTQAGNYLLPRGLFVAAWKVWFKRFSPDPAQWETGAMPVYPLPVKLCEQISAGHRFSLDVACRLMVPWNYRNLAQATKDFIELNSHLIEPVYDYHDPETGEQVDAVKLTKKSLGFWNRRTFMEQDQWKNYAEARIQADIETSSDDPVIIDDAGIEVIGAHIYPPTLPTKDASDEEFIKALVQWIDEEPYQPMYQREVLGESVSSWHERLQAFFWPKPRTGYAEFSISTAPMTYYSGVLAGRIATGTKWTTTEQEYAVRVANEVFNLMGMPQREVTHENVRAVFTAALNEDEHSMAKMNSGWSYLAAIATAHLENSPERLPQAGWNSRVSAAIVSRLDFLLSEAGLTAVGNRFPGIGLTPGWGGTRPREYDLKWPSGYRDWSAHLAGSRLIRTIRDILNTEINAAGELKYRPMPLVGGDRGPWTIRGVELVLFGDGY